MRVRQRMKVFDDRSPYVDKFGLLLTLTVGSVVALSLIGQRNDVVTVGAYLRAAVLTLVVGLTLVLALRASGVARGWSRIADLVIGFVVVFLLLAIALDLITGRLDTNDPTRVGVGPVVWLILAAVSPIVVVRRLIRQRTVNRQTLYGTVSAYLLIPIAFYYLFIVVDTAQGGFFTDEVSSTPSFMYFSLTNLTTLGYGDLTPRTDLARLFSVSEAVLGQVFMVTFVALVVSRFAATWNGRPDNTAAVSSPGPATAESGTAGLAGTEPGISGPVTTESDVTGSDIIDETDATEVGDAGRERA